MPTKLPGYRPASAWKRSHARSVTYHSIGHCAVESPTPSITASAMASLLAVLESSSSPKERWRHTRSELACRQKLARSSGEIAAASTPSLVSTASTQAEKSERSPAAFSW